MNLKATKTLEALEATYSMMFDKNCINNKNNFNWIS